MWHWEPFEAVVAYARELGVLDLDLGALPGTGHLRLGPGDDVAAACATLRASLPDDMRIVAMTADHPGLSAADPSDRASGVAYTVAAMRSTEALGASVVGTSLGNVGAGRAWSDAADCVAESLAAVLAASPANVRLAIELHVDDVCDSLDKAERILACVDSDRLGVCLDTSLLFHHGIDTDEAFDRLGERVFHVHLRGATGDTYFGIPGRDEVDFARFIARLEAQDYAGALSLELYETQRRYGISALDAARESLAYLRRTTVLPGGS